MPLQNINCLRDLYQVIENKKNVIIPENEILILFQKYDMHHKCKGHRYQRRTTDPFERIREDHKILYFILEKLYFSKSNDFHLISAVIERMYKEGILFNNLVSDLFQVSNNFETQQIIEMLEYCLKCTYMKKMLLNGCRMANLDYFFPVMLLPDYYYASSLPKVMGILLRFGMLLDPVSGNGPILSDIDEDTYEKNDLAISMWYSIINEGILCSNPHFLPVNELSVKRKELFTLSVEIAKLLIRDSVEIRMSVFNTSIERLRTFLQYGSDHHGLYDETGNDSEYILMDAFDDTDTPEFIFLKYDHKEILDIIQKLGHFIPGLAKRCLEPTSLKHFCKQTIRKVLHLNWQLPNGIFNLNLPKPLVQYLNLEID